MDLKKKHSEVLSCESCFVPRCILLCVAASPIPLGGVRPIIV